MSGTEGKRETIISSPRDKKKESYQSYRFGFIKSLFDLFFSHRGINGERLKR